MKSIPSKLSFLPSVGQTAIVASLWHQDIVQSLVNAATSVLSQADSSHSPEIYWVPGAFELPQAVQALAKTKKYSAIIPLGCIIRGETPHFNYIAQTVFPALDAIGRETGIAISVGVLTTDNLSQAIDRSGGKVGNKGEEAARAAIQLAHLLQKVNHA